MVLRRRKTILFQRRTILRRCKMILFRRKTILFPSREVLQLPQNPQLLSKTSCFRRNEISTRLRVSLSLPLPLSPLLPASSSPRLHQSPVSSSPSLQVFASRLLFWNNLPNPDIALPATPGLRTMEYKFHNSHRSIGYATEFCAVSRRQWSGVGSLPPGVAPQPSGIESQPSGVALPSLEHVLKRPAEARPPFLFTHSRRRDAAAGAEAGDGEGFVLHEAFLAKPRRLSYGGIPPPSASLFA